MTFQHFKLRPYQEAAVQSAVNWVNYMPDKHGIIWAATAAGKSIIIAKICEAFPNKRILVLAHRKELLEQNATKFNSEESVSIYSAGLGKKDLDGRIVIAGIQSIARARELPEFDLIITDECHRMSNNIEDESQYWSLVKSLGEPQIIGLTATPFRLGGGFLDWGEIIYEIKYPTLLELGFVTALTNKVSETPDLSNVKIKMGEYVESQLEEAMIAPELLEAAITALFTYSEGRESCLVYAVSKKHCELLCEALKESGIAGGVAFVTGDTSDSDRAQILRDFKEGNLRFLINCMVLIEGFDAPRADMLLCLRPTMSKALWEQMLGRVVRLFPSKENSLIIDMAGNLQKHGSLASPYVDDKKGEAIKGEAGRVCPECEEFNEGANITECESCGYEFPEPERAEISHNTSPDVESDAVYQACKWYDVYNVSYRKHVKAANGNVSLRVDYVCTGAPYGSFSEWLSTNHSNEWVMDKTWKFFKERGYLLEKEVGEYEFGELLEIAEFKLATPIRILVDTSKQFPDIKGYEYKEDVEEEEEEFDIDDLEDSIPW